MPHLVTLRDGEPDVAFAIGDALVIGRASACEVQLLDPRVSRRHARLWRDGATYWVEGLDGEVWLDEVRVAAPAALSAGAALRLGGVVVVFDPPLTLVGDREGDRALVIVDGDGVAAEVEPAAPTLAEVATLCAAAAAGAAALVAALRSRTGAERAVLLAVGRGPPRPVAVAADARRLAVASSLIAEVVRARRPLAWVDAAGDARFVGSRSVLALELRAVQLAPVFASADAGAAVVGVVQIDHWSRGALSAASLGLVAAAAACATGAFVTPGPSTTALTPAPWIGADPAMAAVLAQLDRAAASPARVLLLGESGTGKELLAQRLHAGSPRASGPFVALNCAALAEGVIDSELFGHERGAFTGAGERRRGCFERAHGGTLFLDEVGELAAPTQARLLRVLQEGRFFRVGGEQPIDADVRVIAATHRDLAVEVAAGRFREDLYFRLAVVPIAVPPLRARPGDLEPLVTHLLAALAAAQGVAPPVLDDDAWTALRGHAWPGNVRELRNVLERLVVLWPGHHISADELPRELTHPRRRDPGTMAAAVAALEAELVAAAMARAGGNKSAAARALGISRPTLDKKLRELASEPA